MATETILFHIRTSTLIGLGGDVLWADFLWGMSDGAYRHQLGKDSHAYLPALTALVELVDFSHIQVTQPFSLPNGY